MTQPNIELLELANKLTDQAFSKDWRTCRDAILAALQERDARAEKAEALRAELAERLHALLAIPCSDDLKLASIRDLLGA